MMAAKTKTNGVQPIEIDEIGHRGAERVAPKVKPEQAAPPEPKSATTLKALKTLGYTFELNECSQEIFVNSEPITDSVKAAIRMKMRDKGYTNMGAVEDVYVAEAYKNRFHPVKRYFNSLQWDNKDTILELSKFLEDSSESIVYENTQTSRTVAHVWLLRWLVGAVRKVLAPGSQNAMLVLAGDQNLGKSTFVRWLCSPLSRLHIESHIDPNNKEHDRHLASKFIWEVSELGATTRKADVESLKAFISRMETTYRKPYATESVTVPVMTSFCGTVNPTMQGFLNDETGSRRFLILDLVRLDWKYSEMIDIDQLWAQAVHLCNAGEPHQLSEIEVCKRQEINKEHEVVDPIQEFFVKYYDIDATKSNLPAWRIDTISILEHLRASQLFRDNDKSLSTRVGIALKNLGVKKDRVTTGYYQGRQQQRWVYLGIQRVPDEDDEGDEPPDGYSRHYLDDHEQ